MTIPISRRGASIFLGSQVCIFLVCYVVAWSVMATAKEVPWEPVEGSLAEVQRDDYSQALMDALHDYLNHHHSDEETTNLYRGLQSGHLVVGWVASANHDYKPLAYKILADEIPRYKGTPLGLLLLKLKQGLDEGIADIVEASQ